MCNARTLLQVICLSFVVLQSVDSYSFRVISNNSTRIRRQANREQCPASTNFACKSGECIDKDKECDGAVDCRDASDESNDCRRIKCPGYLFRCNYGACINAELECDGKPDCRDGSDENTPKCKTSEAVSQQCKSNEFRCTSGQCINEDFKCDGKAECDDHSDEISATCWNVRCPGFSYRCKYGSCVGGNAECNGIVDCFDGSDEDPTICQNSTLVTPTVTPTPRPAPGKPGTSCTLPEHPQHGSWGVYGKPQQFSPGMYVDHGTVLQISCKSLHKLDGNSVILCEHGQWTPPMGKCLTLCPSRFSTNTMTVTCSYNNKKTVNCTDAGEGTLAEFKCAPFYEDLALKNRPVHICRDGTWDQQEPKCVPVCGQKTVDAQTLIINGSPVKKGDYPWQVALYTVNNQELICGGSLINQRVILTAAHCITDNNGRMQSKELYMVAVGKYYRQYNDTRDYNEAQFSELQAMFIPEQYQGPTQNYLGDIAVLVSRKIFTLSRRVQPVCVDFGQNFNSLERTDFGYVTGWGYTVENDKPSDVLKELKVPSVSFLQCRGDLPEDFHVYLTHDKLCAGYIDNGTSVCKGDSGGGLVFKNEGRYYITGIVSLSPNSPASTTGGCDSQQYGLYTQVSKYINDFVLKKESEFRP